MEFDKKTVAAFVLIGLMMIFLQTDLYKNNFVPAPPPAAIPERVEDTTAVIKEQEVQQEMIVEQKESEPRPETRTIQGSVTPVTGEGELIKIETDLYTAVLSTQGATVKSWFLKDYEDKGGGPVQLVGEDGYGNLAVLLPTREDTIDTSPFIFSTEKRNVDFATSDEQKVEFVLDLGDGRNIVKRYIFYRDEYSVDLEIELNELDRIISGYSYEVSWRSGMRSTEPDFKMDMDNARIHAFQGDAESFDADDDFVANEWDNPTDWVSIKNKYFTLALITQDKPGNAVRLYGQEIDIGLEAPWKKYGFDLSIPFEKSMAQKDRFSLYFGPLDYKTVEGLGVGLEKTMDLGPAIFRPFGWIILWSFTKLHKVIPNYGFVIIVFSILVKIVLFPLTKKSYKSMKEMQALQPVIQELNEKHKDDPQKKQQEMMSIYKEYGINPLGGCIPMVLQMPLLFALFSVFRSTIELRGATFIWWIQDLSRPDTIAHLPFSIPMYGDSVNILPLFMGITMFIQQKMTMKDPKQKAMVYFMPLFLTLLFNSFPSGLNLYYALFNLFSIIQEKFIPYKIRTPEEMKNAAKKKKGPAKKRRRPHDYRGGR